MNERLTELLASADLALAADDVGTADSFLTVILEQAPDLPDALARLGLIRLRQNRPDEAEDMLARASAAVPDAAALHFHLGLARMDRPGPAAAGAALGSFARAIALDPTLTSAYHALGSRALMSSPPVPALGVLRAAHRLDPANQDIIQAFDMAVLGASRRFEISSGDAAQTQRLAAELGPAGPRRVLKIAFVDPVDWDYDVGAPEAKPLGGSQSAMCYLARALAKSGHVVTAVTGTKNPTTVQRVNCRSLTQGLPQGSDAPDMVIILNSPTAGPAVRAQMPAGRPLVLWTQHAHDQNAMRALEDPRVQLAFNVIVCVSDWHREVVRLRYGLAGTPIYVQRNGIGPRFDALALDPAALGAQKAGPPVLVYTSTPFRGLDLLLDAFERIHAVHKDATLRVFSSLAVYNAGAADPYAELYARARSMPGVDYRGSVGQADLARELAGAHMLSYPNTFPETSCITVVEAMAAGLDVVTTHLGALPETCLGLAHMVAFPEGPPDRSALVASFADAVIERLNRRKADPAGWLAERLTAAAAVQAATNWPKRAAEWERLFTVLSRS